MPLDARRDHARQGLGERPGDRRAPRCCAALVLQGVLGRRRSPARCRCSCSARCCTCSRSRRSASSSRRSRARCRSSACSRIPLFIVMNLLSGGNTPLDSMPRWLQIAMQISPSTQFMSFSQAVLFRGAGLAIVWPELAAVAVIGAVFFVGALLRFREDDHPGALVARRDGMQHGAWPRRPCPGRVDPCTHRVAMDRRSRAALRPLAPDIWVAERPQTFYGLAVGTRMTVIRLAGREPAAALAGRARPGAARELDAIGRVSLRGRAEPRPPPVRRRGRRTRIPRRGSGWRPGSSASVPTWRSRRCSATRRPRSGGTRWGRSSSAAVRTRTRWSSSTAPSRTLILCDLAFNFGPRAAAPTRLLMRLLRSYGRFGPSKLDPLLIRDRDAARAEPRAHPRLGFRSRRGRARRRPGERRSRGAARAAMRGCSPAEAESALRDDPGQRGARCLLPGPRTSSFRWSRWRPRSATRQTRVCAGGAA